MERRGAAGQERGGHTISLSPFLSSLPSPPPSSPPPHAFLATVPLLRHDKVMSVWSENLLITAIKDLCRSLGIWCLHNTPLISVNSSCPGLGSHHLPAELLAKLANFCDSSFMNYIHKAVKTIVITIITELRYMTQAVKTGGIRPDSKGNKATYKY